jgi:hypothetical protein
LKASKIACWITRSSSPAERRHKVHDQADVESPWQPLYFLTMIGIWKGGATVIRAPRGHRGSEVSIIFANVIGAAAEPAAMGTTDP